MSWVGDIGNWEPQDFIPEPGVFATESLTVLLFLIFSICRALEILKPLFAAFRILTENLVQRETRKTKGRPNFSIFNHFFCLSFALFLIFIFNGIINIHKNPEQDFEIPTINETHNTDNYRSA